MTEYTYEDVIIDPNDPRVEIGKHYYFALGAQACIDYANRDVKKRTLDDIDTSGNYSPFITDEKDYPFIIRKKETEFKVGDFVKEKETGLVGVITEKTEDEFAVYQKCPNTVLLFEAEELEPAKAHIKPFNLSDPRTRDKIRGCWIRKKDNSEIKLIWWLWELDGKWMIDEDINPQELLNDWVFEDGSPCGIVVEDEQ